MEYLLSILEKVVYIILAMGTGMLCKGLGWLSDQGEKDLGNLMIDFFWPSLIFSSVVTTLDRGDILSNIALPLLAMVIHVTGCALGLILAPLLGYRGDRRRMFLVHATLNNFFVMALPFAQYFFPEKGAALLAVGNLGSMVMMWTLGIFVVAGNPGFGRTLKNMLSPGLVSTIAAILFVLTGLNRLVPKLATDVMLLVGQPALLFGLMIAGARIYTLGRRALRFDGWNLMVGLVRNILIPALMLGLALLLKGQVNGEALTIFAVVAITPASVNSVTLAIKYGSSASLAAEGVIFTHLLSIVTMVFFVAMIERYILV